MELKNYTEANRVAWNRVTPVHQESKKNKFFEAFAKPGFSTLDRFVSEKIKEIGVKGKDAAQICCNDGREALSLKNLGATSVVGFDISDEAISEAQKLSASSGVECRFVRSDVYEIPTIHNVSFDLIYISIGVFGWMPDIDKFFQVVSRLLRSGGDLLIYEQHPFAEVFDPENRIDPLKISLPYFTDKPIVDESGFDYWGGTKYQSPVSYWFVHPISSVISGIAGNGMDIRSMKEFDHDISTVWEQIEKTGKRLPLSYILHAQKR